MDVWLNSGPTSARPPMPGPAGVPSRGPCPLPPLLAKVPWEAMNPEDIQDHMGSGSCEHFLQSHCGPAPASVHPSLSPLGTVPVAFAATHSRSFPGPPVHSVPRVSVPPEVRAPRS